MSQIVKFLLITKIQSLKSFLLSSQIVNALPVPLKECILTSTNLASILSNFRKLDIIAAVSILYACMTNHRADGFT